MSSPWKISHLHSRCMLRREGRFTAALAIRRSRLGCSQVPSARGERHTPPKKAMRLQVAMPDQMADVPAAMATINAKKARTASNIIHWGNMTRNDISLSFTRNDTHARSRPASGADGMMGWRAVLLLTICVGCQRQKGEGLRLIGHFPFRAFIIADLRGVFGISPAVEIAPEERTVASAQIPFGVQQRAGSPDAALNAAVAGAVIFRPGSADANP